MNARTTLSLGLTALMLGGSLSACTAGGPRIASVAARADRDAAGKSARAEKLLAAGRAADAVGWAEGAVAIAGTTPHYRFVLGQSYLRAGRFASAGQAFADVLTLTPTDGRAALNLALAQVAQGQQAVARATLAAHRAAIAPADYGLAIALAGDPAAAVEQLADLVRAPDTDAKARQNLALAHALAGNWVAAKSVAELDLGEVEADKRIIEWAAFARPAGAADQVASLLGVTPAADAGQPVALALVAPAPVAVVQAAAPVSLAPVPVPVAIAAPVAPVPVPAPLANIAAMSAAPAPMPVAPATIRAPAVFRTRLAAAPAAKSKPVPVAPRLPAGPYYVQLGAFPDAQVARDAWARMARRHGLLHGLTPQGSNYATAKGRFYRVSVGGLARPAADRLCRSVKAGGGTCFVRTVAGDQLASWLRGGETRSAEARVKLARARAALARL